MLTRQLSIRIGQLSGMSRKMTAFSFGICAMLTLPPFFYFPLLIPALTGLYWLINGAPLNKRAFWDGWWWGWGFYMTGLYWLCVALLTDAEKFAWLIPFALFGVTGVIALYPAMVCLLWRWCGARGIGGVLVFSILWLWLEMARGQWVSGFPWNLLGYGFGFSAIAVQPASLIGVYGLTWCAVLFGAGFAVCGDATIPIRQRRLFFTLVYGGWLMALLWGALRLPPVESETMAPGVTLRLVQANISQPHNWDHVLQAQGLEAYLSLTQAPGLEKITHIIWPESAVPYLLKADTALTRVLGRAIPPGMFLIAGAMRAEGDDANWRIWNSMAMLDHHGVIVGSYDKHKLVPFGEFLPLRGALPANWLTPVGQKDFSRGPGAQTVNWSGLPPLSPLICYEAVFPELAVDGAGARPQWLLNVTNDAWFGLSTGPYQHFHMARLRAVEQGLPLVRAANTGISAVIDPYGRVLQQLGLGQKGVLDVRLPTALPQATFYSRYPDLFLWILTVFGAFLIASRWKNNRNPASPG